MQAIPFTPFIPDSRLKDCRNVEGLFQGNSPRDAPCCERVVRCLRPATVMIDQLSQPGENS